MKTVNRLIHRTAAGAMAFAILLAGPAQTAPIELIVDPVRTAGAIDLTRYALGQGGLSVEPMFEAQADQIADLRPQTIRLFVQEYFNVYPDHAHYRWAALDRSIETIVATGARPLLSLCLKPRALFPRVDQDAVHPTDYAEWETLIEALVRHCNHEKRYDIKYWEVGNEVDIGEDGGCPYRFQPPDYTNYYAHTARAILRADPAARVGGPALANYQSAIGDALIDCCGQGGAPLHFFSWHRYANDPAGFRKSIRDIKRKLARYPRLATTESIIDEWNIALIAAEPAPGFQAAFVLENTLAFQEEGLSRAAYYHIRDYFVKPADFEWMSPHGRQFMADWWNVKPQNSGLFDNQARRRPAYFAFRMLREMQGIALPVDGVTNDVRAVAARRDDGSTEVVFWNFPLTGSGATNDVILRFPARLPGRFQFTTLNSASNRLEVVRSGLAADLDASPIRSILPPYGIGWVELSQSGPRSLPGQGTAIPVPRPNP